MAKKKSEEKKPEEKTEAPKAEVKKTLGEWAKAKGVEGSGVGASIKFNIASSTLQTEAEFDTLIEKYRNARTY